MGGAPAGRAGEEFAEDYWSWNRSRWLPSSAGARALAAASTPGVTTGGVASLTLSWLHEAVRVPDPGLRAGIILALGAAGRLASHPDVDRMLSDADPGVASAVLYGLGEDGSTRAQLRLQRVLATPPAGGAPDLRPVAAIALAIGAGPHPGVHVGFALRAEVERGADAGLRGALWIGARHSQAAVLLPAACAEVRDQERTAATAAALAFVPAGAGADDAVQRWLGRDGATGLAAMTGMAQGSPVAVLAPWQAALATARPQNDQLRLLFALGAHAGARDLLRRQLAEGALALRGAAALALACQAREHDLPGARALVVAAHRQCGSVERAGNWLLALALVGDPAAGALARQQLERSLPVEARLAALDALAIVGDAMACDGLWWAFSCGESALQQRASDLLARIDPRGLTAEALRELGAPRPSPRREDLLVALGRARQFAGIGPLRSVVGDANRPLAERRAALRGMALWMRPSADSPWDPLAQGVAFAWLPEWLLAAVRALG